LGLLPRVNGNGWRRASFRNGRPRTAPVLMSRTVSLALVEAYNRLDTNLVFAWPDEPAKVLAVTSPLPGEGKTTVALNLAVTLGRCSPASGGRTTRSPSTRRRPT